MWEPTTVGVYSTYFVWVAPAGTLPQDWFHDHRAVDIIAELPEPVQGAAGIGVLAVEQVFFPFLEHGHRQRRVGERGEAGLDDPDFAHGQVGPQQQTRAWLTWTCACCLAWSALPCKPMTENITHAARSIMMRVLFFILHSLFPLTKYGPAGDYLTRCGLILSFPPEQGMGDKGQRKNRAAGQYDHRAAGQVQDSRKATDRRS